MRAANGTGIISTTVLESDDLDEIDWVRLNSDKVACQNFIVANFY